MKHAFLIIAHNNFEQLQLLVSLLDDVCNDIYVHIDKKTKELPNLHVNEAELIILKKRIDIKGGVM